RTGARSWFGRPWLLQLARELAQDVAMRLRVDLAREHLLGARDRDLRDLGAELLARAVRLGADLGARRVELALALGLAVGLRLIDDAARARVRLLDDPARLLAGGRDELVGLCLRLREVGRGLLGGREAGRNLGLPLLDRAHDERPHKLHAEPNETGNA